MSAPPALESTVPLPKEWSTFVKSGILHAIGLARFALIDVRGGFASGPRDAKIASLVASLHVEIIQLREELRIKDARMERLDPHKRPHFAGEERLAILELRTARGWTAAETARRFLISAATIASWFVRRDEAGDAALVRTAVPVNRFPEYVRELVRSIRALFPMLGTKRIAEILARAGLHLAAVTVRRMAEARGGAFPPGRRGEDAAPTSASTGTEVVATQAAEVAVTQASAEAPAPVRRLAAKYAHHVWHIDLSFVPTWAWLWVPWFPFSLPQCWPFGWWVGGVLDHHSRTIVKTRVWRTQPKAARVVGLLRDAARVAGRAPKHIVSDQGTQFRGEYLDWWKIAGVKARFGAVHQHGSIAMIERFWLSMKEECFRRFPVPLGLGAMRAELALYVGWYHHERPHQSLGGLTPAERLSGAKPARDKRRLEPRPLMPIARAGPMTPRRVKGRLELCVVREIGSARLPVVELRQAA